MTLIVRQFDVAEALATLVRIDIASAMLVLLIGSTQICMHVLRWQLLSQVLSMDIGFAVLSRLTLIGFFFNQALPTSFGGDAIRIAMIRQYVPSLSKAISGVMMDRVIALVALIALLAITLPSLASTTANPATIWSLVFVVLACAIGLCFALIFGAAGQRLLRHIPILNNVGFILGDLRRCLTAPHQTPQVFLCAAIIHLLSCLIVYLLAKAMSTPLDIIQCLIVVPAIILVSAIPISFAGWGVREGAMVFFLGQIGISGPDALALSIAVGLMLLTLGLPGGLLWLANPRTSRER